MQSVEDHLARILSEVRPLAPVEIDVAEAGGRTLAAPARARIDLPPFDNSAMDGFAVRFADLAQGHPTTLSVVADLPAGSAEDPPLRAGEAARIMTGSALPSRADTIVPFEDTAGGLADSLTTVTVTSPPREPGAFVRYRGGDLRAGEEVFPAGVLLGPLQLAALSAVGVSHIQVAARPRVIILSTGSELVPAGAELHRGQIPDSNGLLLATLARQHGAEVVRVDRVDDDVAALATLVHEATAGRNAPDAVVFSGGLSAGAYEVVRQSMTEMRFDRIAMQPGKPQGFGVTGRTLLFGLPGNPVSAAVSFEVFVRPALLAMQGRSELARPVLRLPAGASWRTPPARRQYLPVILDRSDPGRWTVLPASSGASHLAASLGDAEGYAIVPAEIAEVQPGDEVDVILIER